MSALTRPILSALGIIVANIILGTISVSLTVVALFLLGGIAIIVLISLAFIGLFFILEKIGLLKHGWTETKVHALWEWAKSSPEAIRLWKEDIKRQIIEYLKRRKPGEDDEVSRLKEEIERLRAIVIALLILVAILLVQRATELSFWWATAIVATAGALITVISISLKAREPGLEDADLESAQKDAIPDSQAPATDKH